MGAAGKGGMTNGSGRFANTMNKVKAGLWAPPNKDIMGESCMQCLRLRITSRIMIITIREVIDCERGVCERN